RDRLFRRYHNGPAALAADTEHRTSSDSRRHRRVDGARVLEPGRAPTFKNGRRLLGQDQRHTLKAGCRVTNQTTMPSAIHPTSAAQGTKVEPRMRVRGLGKHYGALEVFRNIDFDVGEREIVAIVGPSGCGKTTLLRCIDG